MVTLAYLQEDQFTDSFVEYYCGSYHVYYLGYHPGLLQLHSWATTS